MSVVSAISLTPSVFGGGGSQTLAQVLTTGNSAGSSDINMNTNDITGANDITCVNLNYTTLNPPITQAGLTNFVQTSISPTPIFNYTTSGSFQNDILTIPNVPAGTYNLFAMFGGDIGDTMSVQSCRFNTGAGDTGTQLLNFYNYNDSASPIGNGTAPFSMNGIVTLASTTTLFLFVELLFVSTTSSTWEVINLNTGFIKID